MAWSEAQKQYAKSEKGKLSRLKYQMSIKGKETRAKYFTKRKEKVRVKNQTKTIETNDPLVKEEKLEVKKALMSKNKTL